ncbi:hypothetical protein HMPREF0765_4428 [Sphingobacterium spiritivorum ATCC 33300]|uniref:Uncharacterized protein n=1 Tax=Sphingobacterium spiritivorum ATCC 33300 TaxID=525372 RepID=C2G446_SPHSI|nr:hypothetical protein HMPREF0765_4428 [Sphingobacterium spiritivorum ATCC 33300]
MMVFIKQCVSVIGFKQLTAQKNSRKHELPFTFNLKHKPIQLIYSFLKNTQKHNYH